MKIHLILRGGLGNQLFQYALALSLRNRGHEVLLDTSMYGMVEMHNGYELDKAFGIQDRTTCKGGIHLLKLRIIQKYRPTLLYIRDNEQYNPTILDHPKRYINGYWQDERYFKMIEQEVRETLTFKGIDPQNQSIAEEMSRSLSVSLHIRRGDYAAFGMTLIGDAYYRQGVQTMIERLGTPTFYIFSDDKDEAEKMAKDLGINYRLMSQNRGEDSYKDMFLMSQCKHNIIANSSFSWWGAWLNSNPGKIIVAPKDWDSKKPDFHPQLSDWTLL